MVNDIALELIKHDEGLSLLPYEDTEGYVSIGYGRCLALNGISEAEAELMLENDMLVATKDASQFAGDIWEKLSDVRKAVLISMAFNLGLPRLVKFVKFRAALQDCDFETAANEMLDSKWRRQVKGRAERLANLMKAG